LYICRPAPATVVNHIIFMESAHKHIRTIDTLRGIAALTVCVYHFTGKVLPSARIPALAAAFDWGGAGVMIFFVISGFIIPYVLFTSHYQLRDFGSFIGKRFVRICPPSYIVVALIILQWWLYEQVVHIPHPYLATLTPQQVFYNLTYTAPFFKSPWINNVFWTLSIEFQYYLFIALLFPLAFRNVYNFLGMCLLVSVLYYLPVHPTEFFFKWGVLFMMGGATAMYFIKRITLPILLAFLAGLSMIGYLQTGFTATAFALCTALVIPFVQIDSTLGAFLGRISYSLYLLHVLCAPLLEKVLLKIIPTGSLAGKIMMQLLCLLLTIFIAYLFYRFVEKPFIMLANKWFGKKKAARVIAVPAE